MSDIRLVPLSQANALFTRPVQLINIKLPDNVRIADIAYLLGPTPFNAWAFYYKNIPMKINGFVLTTYKDKLHFAQQFIYFITSELSEDKEEDDDRKKQIPFNKKEPPTKAPKGSDKKVDDSSGAGSFGTDKLTKNYTKDTPGQEDDEKVIKDKPDAKRQANASEDEKTWPKKTEVIINPDDDEITE